MSAYSISLQIRHMVKFTKGSEDGDLSAIETDGGRDEWDGEDSDDDNLFTYCLVFGLFLGSILMIFIDSIGGLGPAIGFMIGIIAWIFLSQLP